MLRILTCDGNSVFVHLRARFYALDLLTQTMARRYAVAAASTQARQAAAKYRDTVLNRRQNGFV